MVTHTVRTGSATGSKEFVLPVMTGMQAIHFCHTSAEQAAHNYMRGMPSAAIKGNPVAGANSVIMQGNVNFLELRTQESAAQTLYFIGRPIGDLLSPSTQSMGLSTFTRPAAAGGGATFGVAIAFSDPGSGPVAQGIGSRGTTVNDDINGQVSLAIPTPSDYRMFCLLIKNASTKNEIYDLTKGTMAISTAANTPRFPSSGYYRVGSSYSTIAYLGQIEVCAFAIAAAAHTKPQMDANRAAFQRIFDAKGIFI